MTAWCIPEGSSSQTRQMLSASTIWEGCSRTEHSISGPWCAHHSSFTIQIPPCLQICKYYFHFSDYPLSLLHLQQAMQALAQMEFRPRTQANHLGEATVYSDFCEYYHLPFINPSPATICYFISHLTHCFTSAKSVRNDTSGVSFLHKKLGREAAALASFPAASVVFSRR